MLTLPKKIKLITIVLYILNIFGSPMVVVSAFPDQGKWDFSMNHDIQSITVPKSLFEGSEIYVQITCESHTNNTFINISWMLIQTECWQDSLAAYENVVPRIANDTRGILQTEIKAICSNGNHIPLPEKKDPVRIDKGADDGRIPRDDKMVIDENDPKVRGRKPTSGVATNNPVYTIKADGVYLFAVIIKSDLRDADYNASVHIEMRGTYGFLSAVDWPLLPFYGIMCLVYFVFGLIWLLVSFMQWRDLLRIQFWIGSFSKNFLFL